MEKCADLRIHCIRSYSIDFWINTLYSDVQCKLLRDTLYIDRKIWILKMHYTRTYNVDLKMYCTRLHSIDLKMYCIQSYIIDLKINCTRSCSVLWKCITLGCTVLIWKYITLGRAVCFENVLHSDVQYLKILIITIK